MACRNGNGAVRESAWQDDADGSRVTDERPPICAVCGVTMVPAALSGREPRAGDWICLECEETGESDSD